MYPLEAPNVVQLKLIRPNHLLVPVTSVRLFSNISLEYCVLVSSLLSEFSPSPPSLFFPRPLSLPPFELSERAMTVVMGGF